MININSKNLDRFFPNLFPYLNYTPQLGVHFSAPNILGSDKKIVYKRLKYYSFDKEISQIVNHNLLWACGENKHPIFQFVYILLPNSCNQACVGCYTGQDKKRLLLSPRDSFFSINELSKILTFVKDHGAKAVVYGGMGELFTWKKAFDYIRFIESYGLKIIIFTNGTLLSKNNIELLNSMDVGRIFSLRDTTEYHHNQAVHNNTFISTLLSIENALSEKMHEDSRLAIEIPVTKLNEIRILKNLLPITRMIGMVPMIEEFVIISNSSREQKGLHNFADSRSFFEQALALDRQFNIDYTLEYGTRMIGEPKCQRPLFSFAVFPNRDVADCPSHSKVYGNLFQKSIEEIIYSKNFRDSMTSYNLCPCSVFYTKNDQNIPNPLLSCFNEVA